ncbi:MAG: tRNA (adenosine(37)-N6)-threonylcarbamoyltransferase complex ATPase subunit type 1 TsaE [Desulfohalobiaceae bacterium]|nr:tRNA (adenosine(37)-N6)-threonylcarbamoyltransferase complex ATPase subunit type 1 TsaE [Desulfohalobiaceae bacterium]
MRQYLESLRDTERFGTELARLCTEPAPRAVFFQGELGTGKTTLIQAVVRSLPGSDQAEVSSPSFNIVNFYPTNPPVVHFDLYRLRDASQEESLLEYLGSEEYLLLVEWSEHLPRQYWPQDHVLVRLGFEGQGRSVEITCSGKFDRWQE